MVHSRALRAGHQAAAAGGRPREPARPPARRCSAAPLSVDTDIYSRSRLMMLMVKQTVGKKGQPIF